MRNNLVVGILPESKNEWERRTPLTPKDVSWLAKRKIPVDVASSPLRIYKDSQYKRSGARIVTKFQKANLLIGIKEPPIDTQIPDSVYMVFSHATKGQEYNRNLLTAFLKNKITLIDYEHITGSLGQRLVYFGRYAGICEMIDTLHVFGRKAELQGIPNPFSDLKSAVHYGNYGSARKALDQVVDKIRRKGFDKKIVPFVIGILGHGNVSQGAQEVLEHMGAVDIHPRDVKHLARNHTTHKETVYKLLFQREEKLRSKKGDSFYFEEYLKHPGGFESNLERHLLLLNIIVIASYWDKRYPRLLSKTMLRKLYRAKPGFRLSVIGDLSDSGIAAMAIDNLPCEFPKESSMEFADQVRDFVYQITAHGITDVTNHHALPDVI
jgi:alpha-aminoadipic semialdehyde synthase